MFSDNTLTPKEAIRLCALGTLSAKAMPYSAVAEATRHFISRITGPSLDVMGTSIELLRYEGLVEPVDGVGMEDDAVLAITDAGRAELHTLLTANIRAAATELNKLIMALKFRFLHLLEQPEQCLQVELLVEAGESELARLDDLRAHHSENKGYLVSWLDHDIAALESRQTWLIKLKQDLEG